MWIVMTALMLSMCGSCNAAIQNNNPEPGDSVLLYRLDSMLSVDGEPCIISLQPQNKKGDYNHHIKTLLVFDHPNLLTAPDGVYEVHIGFHSFPGKEDFINLLDLYSHTAPGAKDFLEMDITQQAAKFLEKESTQPVYIIVLFKGNMLPDKTVSARAGKLRLSGIRIIQVKK